MIVVGLTGSMAMGKTQTAKMFGARGIPVFDSDAEVHRLYGKGGAAVPAVARVFPEAAVDGAIDRQRLSKRLRDDPAALRELEAIVHPLVRQARDLFLEQCRAAGERIAVLDIPLLFESGSDKEVDAIVVVTAPGEVQRRRLLDRPGMTAEKLALLLARQMPDAEKRARADYLVDTSQGLDHAAAQVGAIVDALVTKAERSPS